MGRLNNPVAGDMDWFGQQLLAWYDQHGRKQLPWQRNRSAYRVWVSEIMLQQTQVATVIPYFERFLSRFPTVHDLANASDDVVMKLWAGLGYYARARNLHACARQVSQQYGGVFPDTVDGLQELPGIGRSTAGAIVAQAYGKRAVILDGNVKRVLARYRMVSGWPGKTAVQKQLWQLAEDLTPEQRPADYSQAIMDLGSLICRRSKPGCSQCPVLAGCHASLHDMVGQFPEKKKSGPLPEKEVCLMLCYRSGNPRQVLLEKRPPSGIWGGLWSLPQCDPLHIPSEIIPAQYGHQVEKLEEAGEILHRLTHFQLRIRPLWIQLRSGDTQINDSSVQWCDQAGIGEYGLPRPVNQLIANFFDCRE